MLVDYFRLRRAAILYWGRGGLGKFQILATATNHDIVFAFQNQFNSRRQQSQRHANTRVGLLCLEIMAEETTRIQRY